MLKDLVKLYERWAYPVLTGCIMINAVMIPVSILSGQGEGLVVLHMGSLFLCWIARDVL